MKNPVPIPGIHHITAISSAAAVNLSFYETVLGLRLVKQTVNFDDPFTFHLYYGDDRGSPGTLLTFFPWQDLPQGSPGAGMITAVAFAIPEASVGFWRERLQSAGIVTRTEERFGEAVIRMKDPHGLPVELVAGRSAAPAGRPPRGPLEAERAVFGLHSATATLNELAPVAAFLTETLGMTSGAVCGNRHRFKTAGVDTPGQFYDVVVDPRAPRGKPGAGTVHHIAFRTPDDAAQAAWQAALRRSGVAVTDVRDRKYFRSIYFNSPGGVLFEIATDPPGFAVDEAPAELGASLMLPTRYEGMRAEIEGRLPPLRPAVLRHVFKAPSAGADDGRTLVTLHGSGGDEHDLIGFAEAAWGSTAILSPRGNVVENGMARYFKRLADGRFDESDVIARAHELADFVASAVAARGRDPERLTAVGYSNGANIAAAVLLLRPEIFASAVLLRPTLPLDAPPVPDLRGKEILVLQGARDKATSSPGTERLVRTLESAGAHLTLRETPAGHEITAQDLRAALVWLRTLETRERCRRPEPVAEQTA